MKVLISGGGIAGLGAALFLTRAGHEVRVIDRAPAFSKRGYAISLKSFGIKVLTELGLHEALLSHALSYDKLCFYHSDGRSIQTLSAEVAAKATQGQIFTYRSELHGVLHEAATAVLPVHFGVHVVAVAQEPRHAHVTLSDGSTEDVELLVVAEGMRSTTRGLVWGAEGPRPFGVMYAATTAAVEHDLDPKGVHGFVGHGHNAVLMPVDAHRLVMQFYWRTDATERPDAAQARALLFENGRSFGPRVSTLLGAVPPDSDVFCDAVSLIVLESMFRGRVVIIGDAAYCPTFLSGMGASLGLLGAKVLSTSLPIAGDEVARALKQYDATMRPIVTHYQGLATSNVGNALPSSHLKEVLLGWALHFLPASLIARQFGKQFAVEEKLLHGIV